MNASFPINPPRALTLTKVIVDAMDEWVLKLSEGKIVRVSNPSIRAFMIKDMLVSVGVECDVQRMERSAIFVSKTDRKEHPQIDGLYVFSVPGDASWDEDGNVNWGDQDRAIERSFMQEERLLKSVGDWRETELRGMFAGDPKMEDIDQDLWNGMTAHVSAALQSYVLREQVNATIAQNVVAPRARL